jgi:hypothetical protein
MIGEATVEGKIKANSRLLEAVVCTLVFEMVPRERGRRHRQFLVFAAVDAMATRPRLHSTLRVVTSSA